MYFIVGFVVTVVMFFTFDETMFHREGVAEEFLDAEPSDVATVGEVSYYPSQKDEENGERVEVLATTEQDGGTAKGKEKGERVKILPTTEQVGGEIYEVRSYLQRLKFYTPTQRRPSPSAFFESVWLPLYLLRYPSIVFSGILIGSVLAWYNVLIGVIAEVFGGTPYNFSADMTGLTYIACTLGATAGCLVSGWLNDRVATFMARRNQGIKEPEARLWVAIVPAILHPAGCILFGVGGAHGIHWVGLCFGMGLITLAIVMGSTLALSYCVDCYKEVAGEAVVTVIVIRNTIGKSYETLAYSLRNITMLRTTCRIRFWICSHSNGE